MPLRLRHLLPVVLVVNALCAPAARASFPGANGALAFPAGAASIRNQDAVELFAADESGGLRRLAGGAGYQGAPAWSADTASASIRSTSRTRPRRSAITRMSFIPAAE